MTRQFTANVTGLTNTAVVWAAGGVVGGNSTAGTISTTGLYTAPAVLPAQNPVQITARSVANNQVAGSTYVSILSVGPPITSVSPNPIPVGTVTVTIQGSGFLPGATVLDIYGANGVQFSTVSVTPTTVTATGYQGPGTNATFMLRNPGSGFSNSISVPISSGGPTKYSLTVVGGTGSGTYAAGTVVPITATIPAGSTFSSWTGASVANPNSATTTLTMPAASTTVTANFTSGPTYSLTVNSGSGSGTYGAGAVVSIAAAAPPAGQAFLNWTGATVANPNAANTTLTMPAAATTVTANYAAIPVPTISQVNPASVPIGV